MRRAAAVLLALAALAACTDDGDKEAFCERLATAPGLAEILSSVDASDPASVEETITDGIATFRSLETDAPGDVREDMARVRQGMELVLDAVRDNPDDPAGAREQIAAASDELAGLADASAQLTRYASQECGVALEGGGG